MTKVSMSTLPFDGSTSTLRAIAPFGVDLVVEGDDQGGTGRPTQLPVLEVRHVVGDTGAVTGQHASRGGWMVSDRSSRTTRSTAGAVSEPSPVSDTTGPDDGGSPESTSGARPGQPRRVASIQTSSRPANSRE
jgi:hypothetical protein